LEKICVICHEDCSTRPRTKDQHGRYYCKPCYESAISAKRAKLSEASQPPTPIENDPAPSLDMIDASTMIGLADEVAATDPEPIPALSPTASNCPGCDQPLPFGTKLCVNCGINVTSGRSILTSRRLDENVVHANAERILRIVSWPSPIGFSPLASEALGLRRPYTTWAICALTVLVTFWFWFSSSTQMGTRKNLMLWSGNAPLSAEMIESNYTWTDWGDANALDNAIDKAIRDANSPNSSFANRDKLIVEAHSTLTPKQQYVGKYHASQLLTHALLHADIFHLAGNLFFLIIFGSRVNCLIGNIATIIV